MTRTIVFLPGDGIGPEVSFSARAVLEKVAAAHSIKIEIAEHPFGGAAIDQLGDPCPASTKNACLKADAVFLGAVGGPKWDGGSVRPEKGLLDLRSAMAVFANLRPLQVHSGMEMFSPIKEDRVTGVDILIVRELTGGVYFGKRSEGDDIATDECLYSREEVARVARVAFTAARGRKGKVTSVDKANVLATSRLWRKVVSEIHQQEFPDVTLDHMLVDAMAMKLIQAPGAYDVILTENMFGDILSDEASVIAGSIGLSPSASLGATGAGLYEPIHGSAPDIAGQDKANPIGAILSVAMLLRHSLNAEEAAEHTERAVMKALGEGVRGFDLGGELGCRAITNEILERL